MGAYVKIDDDVQYYQPTLVTDAGTDRADEIAVGSDGGGKGYLESSGAQDTVMSLSFANKNLLSVTNGFIFPLGSFFGVWAGAGKVTLRLQDSANTVLFQNFLTEEDLSSYDYAVNLTVVDNAGNIVDRALTLSSTVYDSSLERYKHTFVMPSSSVSFGTTGEGTPLTDLTKVFVYLRGYFKKTGTTFIEYVGGGLESEGEGQSFKFRLRGFAGVTWGLENNANIYFDRGVGVFTEGVEYMPASDVITATVLPNSSATTILSGGAVGVVVYGNEIYTDAIPFSRKSTETGYLDVSMRTIRSKSKAARSFDFKVFDNDNHGWVITSLPSFVTSSTPNGVGTTAITLTFSANDTDYVRYGLIVIKDTTSQHIYQIPCVQWGTECFAAIENVVAGQPKTITAYAATLARNSFVATVAYYNQATFTLYLRQIGFDIADFAAASTGIGTLNMKSGACAGRSFAITNSEYDATNDRWKLTLNRLEDSSVGMVYPNLSYPIEAGDRFVLTDILMPEVYILVAEKKLLAKARVYYDQHSTLKYLYDLEIDSKWIKEQGNVYLHPGMYMRIVESNVVSAYVLIDTVTISENESNIPVFKVTLREKLYLPE